MVGNTRPADPRRQAILWLTSMCGELASFCAGAHAAGDCRFGRWLRSARKTWTVAPCGFLWRDGFVLRFLIAWSGARWRGMARFGARGERCRTETLRHSGERELRIGLSV